MIATIAKHPSSKRENGQHAEFPVSGLAIPRQHYTAEDGFAVKGYSGYFEGRSADGHRRNLGGLEPSAACVRTLTGVSIFEASMAASEART